MVSQQGRIFTHSGQLWLFPPSSQCTAVHQRVYCSDLNQSATICVAVVQIFHMYWIWSKAVLITLSPSVETVFYPSSNSSVLETKRGRSRTRHEEEKKSNRTEERGSSCRALYHVSVFHFLLLFSIISDREAIKLIFHPGWSCCQLRSSTITETCEETVSEWKIH